MTGTVAILAYGSLLSDPGVEIERALTKKIMGVTTPFNIEFARSSRGRGNAPTLVPVADAGAQVKGHLFLLNVHIEEAVDILYRREIDKVGSGRRYSPPPKMTENTVVVKQLSDFSGVDTVLYTDIAANIEPLTPARLAQLAVDSVAKADPGRDGINYLISAKENGIRTALSDNYEAEILRQTDCGSLEEALQKLTSAEK